MTPTEKQELGASFDRATEKRNDGKPLSTLAVLEKCQGDIRNMLAATGSAVKVLRALRRSGFAAPDEMNGPQVNQYTVSLRAVR